jgi:hypothetical protein
MILNRLRTKVVKTKKDLGLWEIVTNSEIDKCECKNQDNNVR